MGSTRDARYEEIAMRYAYHDFQLQYVKYLIARKTSWLPVKLRLFWLSGGKFTVSSLTERL